MACNKEDPDSNRTSSGYVFEGKKFCVDYSIRGTAKRKKCKVLISNNDIRIGKSVPYKNIHILQYYHLQCIFALFRNARLATNVITNTDEIEGFEHLTVDEKLIISNLIHDANANRTKQLKHPTAKKPKKAITIQETSKSRITRLKSTNLPTISVMFTNADQLTTTKLTELKKLIEDKRPMIVAVSEVKQKATNERGMKDYEIPNYTLHSTNLDNNTGRGIAVYSHCSLDKSTIQVLPNNSFEEVCLLEVRLRDGDSLLSVCFYRSPSTTESSDTNNDQLNRFLKYISSKTYSHRCIVGDFNFNKINWTTWTTIYGELCLHNTLHSFGPPSEDYLDPTMLN